jgi:hypothetical protein
MSQLPPVAELDEDQEKRRRARGFWYLRGWLFLGMGLAGIVTVALIVSADRSYAGIDGLRAVRALVPQDGIGRRIRDAAPFFFVEPAPDPEAAAVPAPQPQPSPRPAGPSSPPAGSPSRPSAPTLVLLPVAQQPAPTAPPAVVPPSSATPSASATPSPTPSASASPSPTPTPTLAITTDRGATAVVNLADLIPGDSLDRTITVKNAGGLDFKYTVSATQTASTALWTDTTNGLQLTVRTTLGAVLYSGPLSGLGFLAGPTVLTPGATETLTYTVAFPASAPNAFQGLNQDLTLVFTAVQYP